MSEESEHSVTMVEQLETRLSTGRLLELMDLAACLAAEKYAGSSAVTAGVDDFVLEEEEGFPGAGDVLSLAACVNRAWTTSMEVGVLVSYERMHEGAEEGFTAVCRAYFTFVALDASGAKQKLPAFGDGGAGDALRRFLEAQERRRIRLSRRDTVRHFEDSSVASYPSQGVPGSACVCRKTSLVLPGHANHHGNLFGGIMMRNASEAAFVAASRFHRGARLHSVDDIAFRKKISIGDRMTAYASVNRSFGSFLEVGVRVERLAVGAGAVREHALSCFMIFVLPPGCHKVLAPSSDEEKRRWRAALGRRSIRLERQLLRRAEVTDVPHFSQGASGLLAYTNIKSLLNVYNNNVYSAASWKELLSDEGVVLSMSRSVASGVTAVKVTGESTLSPERLLQYMLQKELRKTWDVLLRDMDVVQRLDDDNDVVQATFVASPTEVKEFVLLRSWRREAGGRIVYAARSVTHDEYPVREGVARGVVSSSGIVLSPEAGGRTRLSYVVQLSSSALGLLKGDLVGDKPLVLQAVQRLVSFHE